MGFRGLHLVSGPPNGRLASLPSGGDVALLVFILGVHLALLLGFFLGVGWGDAVAGYSTAVVLVAGRELVHELARRLWDRNESHR